MRLDTTKTFANFLQKEMRKRGLKYDISLEKLTDNQYSRYVDIMGRTDAYDYNTGLYSVLKVVYPCDYYACDKYITREELYKLWNGNLENFLTRVRDCIEI